jgi:glutamine---fructose-6-phosphate transaminase (isomerizing)
MCGIIGYIGQESAREQILDGLTRLEYRGYDSAGLAVIADGEIREARGTSMARLAAKAGRLRQASSVGIGHTRWATHGAATVRNAHPFLSCDGRLAVVVNGIIENFQELRLELSANGHGFRSQTDAEVIAHLLEERDLSDPVAAITDAVGRLDGHFAFVVLDRDRPDWLVGTRRHCPLVVGRGRDGTFLTSMTAGFSDRVTESLIIEDDEVVVADGVDVWIYDAQGSRADRVPISQATRERVTLGSYQTYMEKEIFDQPDAVRHTLTVDPRQLVVASLAKRIDRILMVACGTAYHAGLCGQLMFEEWSGLPCDVAVASEWRYRRPFVSAKTLVIAISQSGETADTLAAAAQAKQAGATVLALTNSPESQLARDHRALITQAGLEVGVAATKTFTTQVAALARLALCLSEERGSIETAAISQELREVPSLIERFLVSDHPTAQIAERLADSGFVFYLGRHSGYPMALEGALKLKELAYIPSDAYAAGEMKHGPIALIGQGTPVIAVCPDSHISEKTISNIEEVRARGAQVIAVAAAGDEKIAYHVDQVISVPRTDPLLAPLVASLPLQLLAMGIASQRGLNVDRPRNLAKTVTVE